MRVYAVASDRGRLNDTPTNGARRCDADDRPLLESHGAVLAILAAEQGNSRLVLGSFVQKPRFAEYQHVSEALPILIIAIDDDRDLGIEGNISHSARFFSASHQSLNKARCH
jgi:hypothetical protein